MSARLSVWVWVVPPVVPPPPMGSRPHTATPNSGGPPEGTSSALPDPRASGAPSGLPVMRALVTKEPEQPRWMTVLSLIALFSCD